MGGDKEGGLRVTGFRRKQSSRTAQRIRTKGENAQENIGPGIIRGAKILEQARREKSRVGRIEKWRQGKILSARQGKRLQSLRRPDADQAQA